MTVLDHDRYYRDRNDLRLEERAALNYDHPDALETDLMVRHVRELMAGRSGRGASLRFRPPRAPARDGAVSPRRAVIVEGILVFTPPELRQLMDIKVFVDTDSDTTFIRRLVRDVADRGRTMESVIDQYQSTVKPMHLEFVEPSKRYADVIIPVGGQNTVAVDLLLTLLRSVAGPRMDAAEEHLTGGAGIAGLADGSTARAGAAVRDEPHDRHESVDRERNPRVDESQRDACSVQHWADSAFDVLPKRASQP